MSSPALPAPRVALANRSTLSPAHFAVRGPLLAALLLAEIIFLSLRFDSQSLVGRSEVWAVAVRQVPGLVRLAGVAGLSAVLFAALRRRSQKLPTVPPPTGQALVLLTTHFLALGLFTAATALILEGPVHYGPHAEWWALTWAVLGGSVLLSWAGLLVAPAQWLPLIQHTWRTLLGGVAVGIAVACGTRVTSELWASLGTATLHVSALLLRLVTPGTVCRPEDSILGTSTFQVEIAPACSGYEGIALVTVFLSVYLWLFRRQLRFPAALVLLPVGVAVIWLANALRIALLIVVGTWLSPALALGGFHSQAGWLAFLAVSLGLVAVSRRSRLFQCETATVPQEPTAEEPTTAYVLPLLGLLLTQMITAALHEGFDSLLPLRVLVVGGCLWYYRRQYDQPLWCWSWSAAAVGVIAFACWALLEPLYQAPSASDSLPTHLAELPPWAAGAWLLLRVLHSVVLVPMAEELAFRGFLLRRLIAADFQAVSLRRFALLSFVILSLCFGALHSRWLAGSLCGMLFALAVYRRGRLADAVLAHAVANALIAACVLLGGAWYFWN